MTRLLLLATVLGLAAWPAAAAEPQQGPTGQQAKVNAPSATAAGGEDDSIGQARASRRKLWLEGVQAPDDEPVSPQLQRAIRQAIDAGTAPPPSKAPSPKKTDKTTGKQTAAPVATAATTKQDSPAPKATATSQPQGLTPKAMGRLRILSAKGVSNPGALGDSLFLGGHLAEAAELYQMALKLEQSGDDRAWLLFQIGNCMRVSDPDTASGFYRRVVSECPDCPWAGVAQVQGELIEWHSKFTPGQVVKEAATAAGQKSASKDAGAQSPTDTKHPQPAERSNG